MSELEVVWTGADWRKHYAPKPAPALPTFTQPNRKKPDFPYARQIARLLTIKALTIRAIEVETKIARSTVQVTVQYLRRERIVSVIATQREGERGRPSAVYSTKKRS